ncbi:divalent-cation tolerance protein CutA [Leptolyngbya sp. AN02str]|uniref:divalent-cation tolerance protein CutA n=1 Tax=Leptolyngbya sp. AN02str TaxID=3423363 RepID=UPI003D312845
MTDQQATTQSCGIVLVTAPNQEVAQAIAQTLVEKKLAACVSITPIQSIYVWEGSVHNDVEWQLVIKTNLDDFADLEAQIRRVHPYQVPEIVAIPFVQGSSPYLQWIQDNTRPKHNADS